MVWFKTNAYHICSHAVTNEEENVLGSADLCKIADMPIRDSGRAIVVSKSGLVVTRVTESDSSVSLRRDINERWLAGISGEKI